MFRAQFVSAAVSYLLAWTGLDTSGVSPALDADAAFCRCVYGESCWPGRDTFAGLASQLSHPLIYPHPLAQACHLSPNSTACSITLDHWEDGNWRADHPGATQHPNFETFISSDFEDACYRNTSLPAPCGQGSVPVIGVDAYTERDVQLAVNFAAKHDLKLVVKNTGHDFLGRSSGRGSFMIWTHHLKTIEVHNSFRAQSAPPGEIHEAITVAAGVQWHEAYAAVAQAGRMMVGGVSAGGSVGAAGGWLLGGGHSILSPSYGLGVDNVLEISLVTASGDTTTANAYQHPDLFWALRGGGGGTFGVVTSVTYRTHPIVPVVGAYLSLSQLSSHPNQAMEKIFTELVRISVALTDAGWGGYAAFLPAANSLSLDFFALVPNASWEAANRTILPYFDYVRAVATEHESAHQDEILMVHSAITMESPSFWSLYQKIIPSTGQVGFNLEIGSWLLPRSLLEDDHVRVAQTLLAIPGMNYELVAGGVVSQVDPHSTGLNPAWRKAVIHAAFGTIWPDGTSYDTIAKLRDVLKGQMARVRELAPESGAYFNEASMYEADFRHSFFGSHYERLKSIKEKYDPGDLFIVTEGVGADGWDEQLRCRV